MSETAQTSGKTSTLTGPATFGAPGTTWTVDSASSGASFKSATLWGLVPVEGDLGTVSGTLHWDGSSGSGRMSIRTGELSSGIGLRDHHLRSRAFFAVADHPELKFEVSKVSISGRDVVLDGELDLRGRRRPFGAAATATDLGDGGVRLDAEASFLLEELGMSRGLMRMIRPEVTAAVHVVLRPAA